jgi:hypothetical protein
MTTETKTKQGLVIRWSGMGGYFLCDGIPHGYPAEEGEIYVGQIVKWFATWEEADSMRKWIAELY